MIEPCILIHFLHVAVRRGFAEAVSAQDCVCIEILYPRISQPVIESQVVLSATFINDRIDRPSKFAGELWLFPTPEAESHSIARRIIVIEQSAVAEHEELEVRIVLNARLIQNRLSALALWRHEVF